MDEGIWDPRGFRSRRRRTRLVDPIAIATLGMIGMFVPIALRVPIGVAGVAGFGLPGGWNPAFPPIGAECFTVFANPDLAVIPLLVPMGRFAGVGGLSADIHRLAGDYAGEAQPLRSDEEGRARTCGRSSMSGASRIMRPFRSNMGR